MTVLLAGLGIVCIGSFFLLAAILLIDVGLAPFRRPKRAEWTGRVQLTEAFHKPCTHPAGFRPTEPSWPHNVAAPLPFSGAKPRN